MESYDIRYVALYLRKSRAESEDDLQKHRDILIELCNKYDFTYIEYAEIGTSDSIDERPQMSKLLKEVEQGLFDAVCVVDYDRLSRGDLGDQDRVKKAFKKSNTFIITPSKIYNLNNDDDDTFANIKGFFAREEYKAIRRRLIQGKMMGSRRGYWTNGPTPFPYEYERYNDKYNPKGLVANDDKLVVYRRIIDWAIEGLTTSKIAIALNKENILSPNGVFWNATTISRMLVDETHLGKMVSNKTQGDGHKSKKSKGTPPKRIPKEEWVIVENCHEAVKTLEEHETILALLAERSIIPMKARKKSYSLTGLIKCGKCGHTMTFYESRDKRYLKPCWYRDAFGNKCENKGIKIEFIEQIVLDKVREYKDNSVISNICEDANSLNNIKLQIDQVLKQISKIDTAIERIDDSYELGGYDRNQWLQRKKKRQDEKAALQNQLYLLNNKLRGFSSVSYEEKLRGIDSFLESIIYAISPEERNQLYSTIIDQIVWIKDDDDINIDIQFK